MLLTIIEKENTLKIYLKMFFNENIKYNLLIKFHNLYMTSILITQNKLNASVSCIGFKKSFVFVHDLL